VTGLARKLIDLLFPPDPGALRVLAALRATLAGVLTFFAVILLGTVTAVPTTDRILGFAIALFIAANVRDSTQNQRLVTIALAPLPAFGATAAAALLLGHPVATTAVVPPLMAVIAYGAGRSPRWATLGIVALIGYIIGLVTRQPPDTLPVRAVVLLLAAADAALVRCVLLPERPHIELDRLRRAIHSAVDRVLLRIGGAIEAGAWTDASRGDLHREIYRLGEIVMLAQARVAALGSALPDGGSRWLHLLTIELGVERVARIASRDLGPPAEQVSLLAALDALRNRAEVSEPQPAGSLLGAIALLGRILQEGPQPVPFAAAAPPPAAPVAGLGPAIQTAIAATLAVIAGELVSPARWYWAAFTAYVMFQGTRTRGESVAKGIQFIVGTAAGVLIGMGLATLLSGEDLLTLTAIVAAVFLAFQANVAAFGVMIFWITIILGLLFGMLGYFAPDFLLLRLQEAAAGVACGAAVASFVLVRREYAATYAATIAFLRALGQSVESAARALIDHQPAPNLTACIVTAEQRFRELNVLAGSEQSSHPLTRNETLRRRLLLLEACEQWARELGHICLRTADLHDPALATLARQCVTRIHDTLAALIESFTTHTTPQVTGHAGLDVTAMAEDTPAQHAVRLLLRIDSALLRVAEEGATR
jgi:uncharacterized membrane protein YccC